MRTRRKREGGIDCPIDLEVESESILSLAERLLPVSKHRTCWIHMAAFMSEGKMKMSKKELKRHQLTSECFSGTFPCRLRSNRATKRTVVRSIKVTPRQKMKLDSAQFDSYFNAVWSRLSQDKKTCFAYLDSLWFSMYMLPAWKDKAVQWIKAREIFTKAYVIVPIVCWGHWNLLILCNLGESLDTETAVRPCMLLLDSLENADPRRIEPSIRKFLLDIYKSEGRAETKQSIRKIPLLVPKVPQQTNDEECGRYVLYYIHLFMQAAPQSFSMEDYPNFMTRDWFTPECLEHFFEELDSVM
ncbi:Probable ubiquitin-like-specific protease 2A [Linum perenne]